MKAFPVVPDAIKLLVMIVVVGGLSSAVMKADDGLTSYFANIADKDCIDDAAAAGVPTKMVGTECYYHVAGRWVDIVDVAANADSDGAIKPEFRRGLRDRAQAAIDARRPLDTFGDVTGA